MFTNEEFVQINAELKRKLSERNVEIKKIWGICLVAIIFVIIFLILLFPRQFDNSSKAWILPTYGGMAFVAVLIGFIVSLNFTSEKPFFEYLYKKIVQKINLNEGIFLEYNSYDKESKAYVSRGGLFSRFCSVINRRVISGKSGKGYNFDIYDCTLSTSNGKSKQIHFDGVYFVLHKQLNTVLQIRSNGSPKQKGKKFERFKEFEEIKVYKEQGQIMNNTDQIFLKFMLKQKEYTNYKRVYLSVVNGQIHIAIWYKNHPLRKQKNLSINTLNSVYKKFLNEYNFIKELEEIDNFNY